MPQLKLGTTGSTNSFYDPNTNAYITPGMPPQIVNYDDSTDLTNIALAVLSQFPSLRLYEGKLPQTAIDAYKASMHNLPTASSRADAVNLKAADVVTGTSTHANGKVKENEKDLLTVKELEGQEELSLESVDDDVSGKQKKSRSKAVAEK